MSTKIIDGKALSEEFKSRIREEAITFENKNGRKIGLAVILVGENAASKIYVRNKILACERTNVSSFEYYLPENSSENEVIELIRQINNTPEVDGLLVQLPLPDHMNEKRILAHVSPEKDVDGFHAMNAGNLLLGNECLAACTPSGIIELIKSTGVEIAGKHAVVIGRSNIVGKPIAMLLLQNDATVTVCHSKTKNLKDICRLADILIVAVGKPKFVTEDMIKKDAVVIDVGINRDENGKLCGDVDFENVKEKASLITPVPGGVGPMTITMLLYNTCLVALKEEE